MIFHRQTFLFMISKRFWFWKTSEKIWLSRSSYFLLWEGCGREKFSGVKRRRGTVAVKWGWFFVKKIIKLCVRIGGWSKKIFKDRQKISFQNKIKCLLIGQIWQKIIPRNSIPEFQFFTYPNCVFWSRGCVDEKNGTFFHVKTSSWSPGCTNRKNRTFFED